MSEHLAAGADVAGLPPRSLPYEPSLDGVRAVAIAAVALYHGCRVAGLDRWARGGFIGVSVFFTLSGFLITSLLLTERERAGRVDLHRFWVRRIRRLAPAGLAAIAGVVALSAADVLAARASDATAAIWGVTNWHVIAAGDGKLLQTIVGPLGPTWSLGVEEQLYVLLVVAVVVSARSRAPAVTLLVLAIATVGGSTVLANTVSDWRPRLEFGTDIKAAEVAVGVALAVVWHARPTLRWTARAGDVAAGVALAALLACFAFVDLDPPWLLRGGYTVISLVSATLITGLLAHGRVATLLSLRPIVYLGRISYSLYVVHWPVMSVLTAGRVGVDGWGLVTIDLAAAVGVAVALHHLVEQPVRRGRSALAPTLTVFVAAGAALTVVSFALLA